MTLVLMTENIRKIREFQTFFGRHAQEVLVETPTEAPATLAAWLAAAKAVLADESNIYTLEGDLVAPEYVGPARNVCRLHAWVLKDGGVRRMSYLREVRGTFDGRAPRPDDGTVFGWDAAFTPEDGPTLHRMAELGLKNSAREQCLSAFTRDFLRHKEPKKLRWRPVAASGIVDWDTDARLLVEHPMYRRLPPTIEPVFRRAINGGVYFRAAHSRRDGNYWFSGSGGIPYVQKGDPTHEGKYMFHDLTHQPFPNLIHDGTDGRDHRRAAIGVQLMGEAISLTLTDMLLVDELAGDPAYAGYDFSAQRIYPMYQALSASQPGHLQKLLFMMMRFVTLGDRTGFPVETEAWRRFEEKYTRFFVGDFQWARMNWANLVGRTEMSRRWIELVGPETFRAQGYDLVSDVVGTLDRGLSNKAFIGQLADYLMRTKIEPALRYDRPIDLELSFSNGFRRWLTGQCAFFARYAPIVGIPKLGEELAARVRDPARYDRAEAAEIRRRFGDHVRGLAKKGLISDDDAAIFPDVFPLFDPFFLRDYDRAKQEFATIEEASRVAFA